MQWKNVISKTKEDAICRLSLIFRQILKSLKARIVRFLSSVDTSLYICVCACICRLSAFESVTGVFDVFRKTVDVRKVGV